MELKLVDINPPRSIKLRLDWQMTGMLKSPAPVLDQVAWLVFCRRHKVYSATFPRCLLPCVDNDQLLIIKYHYAFFDVVSKYKYILNDICKITGTWITILSSLIIFYAEFRAYVSVSLQGFCERALGVPREIIVYLNTKFIILRKFPNLSRYIREFLFANWQ